jgi:Chaperone of endosialidase
MADWNTPTLGSTYTNVLNNLKDRDVDVLKMLDGVTPTNLPSGAKRWNSSANTFENWNGTAWTPLLMTPTLANNAFLKASNAAGSGYINILGVNTIDQTVLSSANNLILQSATKAWSIDTAGTFYPIGAFNLGTVTNSIARLYTNNINGPTTSPLYVGTPGSSNQNLIFYANGVERWTVEPGGTLTPWMNDSYSLGKAPTGGRILEVHALRLKSCALIEGGGEAQTIGTTTDHRIYFKLNNTIRWGFTEGGSYFYPQINDTYSLGYPGTNRIANVYTNAIRECLLVGGSGGLMQVGTYDANTLAFFTNSAQRWLVNSGGTFYPYNNVIQDLGGSANHIYQLWAYIIRTTGTNGIHLGTNDATAINFFTSNTNRWMISGGDLIPVAQYAIGGPTNATWAIYTQHVWSVTGAELALRAGGLRSINLYTNETARWAVIDTGMLYPVANNTYDIGSTGLRVRTIYANNALNTSDARLKKAVHSLVQAEALDKICSLDPIAYKFIDSYDDGSDKDRVGFLAQKVIEHIPVAVARGDDGEDRQYGDDGFEGWSMQSEFLLPYIVAAIKELRETKKDKHE